VSSAAQAAAAAWRHADYREPLVLVCLRTGAEYGEVYRRWSELPERNVRLAVVQASGREAEDELGTLASQVERSVAGLPYALFAGGDAAVLALAVLPLLDTRPPVSRLIIASAAPPDPAQSQRPGPRLRGACQVPISVMCAAADPATPVSVMAGWRRLSAEPFTLQVFAETDFLRRQSAEVLRSVQQDLRVQRSQVPGCGFELVRI
jgi:surfactin synthase thioesterase subunit